MFDAPDTSGTLTFIGQAYEKKVKKNARDATEEHSRYIQLLSSLGHEMSQEQM